MALANEESPDPFRSLTLPLKGMIGAVTKGGNGQQTTL